MLSTTTNFVGLKHGSEHLAGVGSRRNEVIPRERDGATVFRAIPVGRSQASTEQLVCRMPRSLQMPVPPIACVD